MKERPIIFSAPMVRTILSERKIKTQCVMKPQPEPPYAIIPWIEGKTAWKPGEVFYREVKPFCWVLDEILNSPFGHIGDRVWVRERWRVGAWKDGKIAVDYRADGHCRREWLSVPEDQYYRLVEQSCDDAIRAGLRPNDNDRFYWSIGNSPCRWRPSSQMPNWASRITLEVTDSSLVKSRNISKKDARFLGTNLFVWVIEFRLAGS
jgi:hypothetical protein